MTFPPDPRNNPAAKAAVAKFRANKFEPEAYTLYSYAAVQVMAQAARSRQVARPEEGRRENALRHEVQDRDRRSRPTTRRVTSPASTTRCTCGRRTRAARSLTSNCRRARLTKVYIEPRAPAPSTGAGVLLFSRCCRAPGKTSSSQTLTCVDAAGEKGDPREHQQRAHRLLNAMQMALEAREKGRERLDGEGGGDEAESLGRANRPRADPRPA